jgi:hypothetical protein
MRRSAGMPMSGRTDAMTSCRAVFSILNKPAQRILQVSPY